MIDYTVVLNANDTWTVVHNPTNENLSHHETKWAAQRAVERYQRADAQRRAEAAYIHEGLHGAEDWDR